MREVTILANPVASPGVCAKCGSQNKDWFVDCGFDIDYNQKMEGTDLDIWLDGILYLCCDCLNGLITDVNRKFIQFNDTHDVRVPLHGFTEPELSSGDDLPDGPSEDTSEDNSGFKLHLISANSEPDISF